MKYLFGFILIALLCGGGEAAEKFRKRAEAQPSAPAYVGIFDFKGIGLGMPLSEFKNMPAPKDTIPSLPQASPGLRQTVASVGVECSDAESPSSETFTDDGKFGVTDCVWVVTKTDYGERKSISDLTIGGVSVQDYRFRFIKVGGDAEPRLFYIRINLHSQAFTNIAPLLSEKFGPPTATELGSVQNSYGAVFANETLRWENSTGSIIFVQRHNDVKSSVLIYSLARQVAEFAERVRIARTSNGIPQI